MQIMPRAYAGNESVMDTERMKEFVVLAEHMNFSSAARALHMSQPTLSRHMADLERDIGCPLIRREPTGLRLTSVGHVALEGFNRVVMEYESAMSCLAEARAARDRSIRVQDFSHAPNMMDIYSLALDEMRAAQPLVRTSFRMVPDGCTVAQAVVSGELDVGLDYVFHDQTGGSWEDGATEFVPLWTWGMAVGVEPDHRLAGRSHISLTDLDGELLLSPARTSYNQFRSSFERLCTARGFVPRFDLRRTDNLREFYASRPNGSLFILGEGSLNRLPLSQRRSLKLVTIDSAECVLDLGLVCRPDWKRGYEGPLVDAMVQAAQMAG